MDVGTLNGYREAIRFLGEHHAAATANRQGDCVNVEQLKQVETLQREGHGERASVRQRIEELGPWFHNMRLAKAIETAPHHFLGDYPEVKFRHFREVLPVDATGMSVLDIGCNAGFYSLEMKRRGAEPGCWASIPTSITCGRRALPPRRRGSQVDFRRKMPVWDVGRAGREVRPGHLHGRAVSLAGIRFWRST